MLVASCQYTKTTRLHNRLATLVLSCLSLSNWSMSNNHRIFRCNLFFILFVCLVSLFTPLLWCSCQHVLINYFWLDLGYLSYIITRVSKTYYQFSVFYLSRFFLSSNYNLVHLKANILPLTCKIKALFATLI